MNDLLLKFAVTLVGDQTVKGDIDIPSLSAEQVVINGLDIVYFILGIIAVIVIIIGGITYATSAGNAANVTKAKNMLLYAVIGLVIVIAAFAITDFVLGRF